MILCRKMVTFILIFLSVGFVSLLFTQNSPVNLQQHIFQAKNKVMPALVHIEPVRTVFSTGERRHALVTGSGFIFSKKGYILTNHHVVENAEKVSCTLSDKKKYSAKIIGSDPSTDVAVIQLNPEEFKGDSLPYVTLGNSDSLEVGQIVLALGSPLGLSRSVSMGVISSIDRYFEDTGRMVSPFNLWIQTDAAINPGNSGGPLINLDGEVVGINARGVFMAENLGFAIPINLAKEVAEKLIGGETVQRSWIGVEIQSIKDLREYLQKPDLQGVLVDNLDPASPAEKAGIIPGDIITAINEIAVNATYEEDLPAVRKIISDLPVSQSITLSIWRNGISRSFNLKPQEEPFQYQPEFECEEWGMVVKGITRLIFQAQGLEDYDGVYISAVKNGELAERAGLRAGDIIRWVNKKKIFKKTDFENLYHDLSESQTDYIFFEVLRQSTPHFAAINLRKNKK
jgi:serine protease Do